MTSIPANRTPLHIVNKSERMRNAQLRGTTDREVEQINKQRYSKGIINTTKGAQQNGK